MRHRVDGRQFGRNTSHRIAMLRNMANSVIEKEQIVTTVQKAKEARRIVDRLVGLGKSGTEADRRLAFSRTRNRLVVSKLFDTLADRYKNRNGGYTRVIRVSERRFGDAAEMAVLELVDHPELNRKKQPKAEGSDQKEGTKKSEETQAKTTDPFGRFRKLFSGSKKTQSGGLAGKGMRAGKAGGAGRKTPAASGGNKSGGSSD